MWFDWTVIRDRITVFIRDKQELDFLFFQTLFEHDSFVVHIS